ncbi:MAG: hypothetical protein HFI11_12445 [Lachnospiraceae bacterium]|nr:hypothetical protein [Lachnospiraceae bacterium]
MSRNINMENNMQEVDATMNSAEKNNNVEAETMANEINKNEEGKVMEASFKETADTIMDNALAAAMPSDIDEIIPAEERGVSEKKHSKNIVPLTVVEIIEPLGNIIPEIPENERAEVTKEDYIDLKESIKHGFFDPVRGMKGFKTNTGHLFYARIFTDSKGNRWIEYCQQYSDDSYSAKMNVKQADLIAGAYFFCDEENTNSGFMSKNTGAKIVANVRNDYYNKTAFPKECVSIKQLFLFLLSIYSLLPTESDSLKEYDYPDRFYADIMMAIRKNQAWFDDSLHKAYYALNTEQIDKIANTLNIKRDLLLKKLKEYKFLYLTDSSKGYQTCVRFPAEKNKLGAEFFPESYTKWSYCILNLEYLANQLTKKKQK